MKPPPLKLSPPSDDVAAFIEAAPTPATTPPSSAGPSTPAPSRGHVMQASGRVVRRLVVNIPTDLGAELDRRHAETGIPLSRLAADALRRGLGL